MNPGTNPRTGAASGKLPFLGRSPWLRGWGLAPNARSSAPPRGVSDATGSAPGVTLFFWCSLFIFKSSCETLECQSEVTKELKARFHTDPSEPVREQV